MAPHRSNGVGTFRLDVQVRHVGRIARASGTTDLRTFRRMKVMLRELRHAGRLDLLQALHDGVLAPMVLYAYWKDARLDELPRADALVPIGPAWEAWVSGLDCSEEHRRGLRKALRRLEGTKPDGFVIATLEQRLRSYRLVAQAAKQPVAFNRTRAAVQAFLRDVFGRRSTLYGQVADVQPLKAKRKPVDPLLPIALKACTDKMAPERAAEVWTMARTGMLPSEYWGEWSVELGAVRILGTKREGRSWGGDGRRVPIITAPTIGDRRTFVRPGLTPRKVARWLALAGGPTLKTLRSCYAHWIELAGIPRTRRRIYMGHSAKDVTDLYEEHQIIAFLAEDAATLSAWLEAQLAAPTVKRRAK